MQDMLKNALEYARRGWYVFPCREKPGAAFYKNGEKIIPKEKTPYTPQGLLNATLEEKQIEAWWHSYPSALIGVNAGKSGLFVIDIDKKHVNGLDTFSSWEINDTAGLHSFTPSGGIHIVFTGTGKSSSNGTTGIDTRGEGGYFIAPPSIILEGERTGEYKAFDDWSRTPGVIPDGLMSKLFPNATVEYVRGSTSTTGGKKQLSRATLNFLANGAPAGERNNDLFKVLADFNGCGYTMDEARDVVAPVCDRINFSRGELEGVIAHAYAKPRTASIPDSIQEKIASGDKKIIAEINAEEQTIIENALLACMMMDNNVISSVNDILNYDDFQTLKTRIIYRIINRLYNQGMKVDIVTVSNMVAEESDKVSTEDISTLINQYFINTDNVLSYAAIIREKASIRKVDALLSNRDKYMAKGNLVEIISNIEKDVSDIAIYGGAKSTNILNSKQATDYVAEQTRKILDGEIEQLKTGFTEYDYHVGGLFSNDFVICAGRAGEGKSALALSILNDVGIKQNKPCLMFSLEMSTHETICRLICQLTGLPFKNVYLGKLKDGEWKAYEDAMARIAASNLHFDDGFGMNIPEIRSKIRKMMEKDLKLVVIDQLEQIKGYENLQPYQQYDKICYDIKNFNKEFNIPIILNHQLNRNITDRKLKNPEPQLSDLNQAGEKPATQVWVISHRKDDRGKIIQSKIKMLKNRNGPKVEFAVIFLGERMLFSNPSREEDRYVFPSNDEEDFGITPTDDVHQDAPEWAK
jgi:replicative DNA helicase